MEQDVSKMYTAIYHMYNLIIPFSEIIILKRKYNFVDHNGLT